MNLSVFLAAVIAAFLNMVVGALWYTPATFGNVWAKDMGIKKGKTPKGGMATPLIIGFISSLITAYVLLLVPRAFSGTITDMIVTVLVVWIGFIAAVRATHFAFEGKSLRIFLITALHDLVGLLVMAFFFWFWF